MAAHGPPGAIGDRRSADGTSGPASGPASVRGADAPPGGAFAHGAPPGTNLAISRLMLAAVDFGQRLARKLGHDLADPVWDAALSMAAECTACGGFLVVSLPNSRPDGDVPINGRCATERCTRTRGVTTDGERPGALISNFNVVPRW